MIDITKLRREIIGTWGRDGYVVIRGRDACALLAEVEDARRKLRATAQSTEQAYALLAADDRLQIETEHWVHGSDESLSYCYDCATKEVARLHLWLWRAQYLREREEQERRRALAEVAGWAPLAIVSLREERDRLYRQIELRLWRAAYLREREAAHG